MIRISAVVLALCALAGCTVGPDYVRPPVQSPAAWKEAAGWKAAEPRDHLARGAWWKMFGDPQLDALEAMVDISNQNVAAAEAQFRVARALAQAAQAGYYPVVTAGTSVARTRASANGGGNLPAGTLTNYLASGAASWEPDIWGRVRRSVEAGRAGAQASAADLEAARLSAHAALAQDYFQLRALDAQKQLLDETIAEYQKFLLVTQNRYKSGVAAKGDVLQAETQLKTVSAQRIDLGVPRAQLEHAIATLAGKSASDLSIPASPLLTGPPAAFPAGALGVPSELLERRPDIAAAERNAAAANAQIGIAESAWYPALTLSAAGGFSATDLSHWLIWPSRFWSVGPAVAETVYDGGLRRALSDQARAAYDAIVASYRQVVLAAFQDVEDNLAALRILEQESAAQDEAVKAAEQSAAFVENQYKQGTASALDVVATQTVVLANRRTAADILGRRMTACVLLIKALGGGWDASALPSEKELDRRDKKQP